MIEQFFDWLPDEASRTTLNMILLGVILSISLFADTVANRTRIPRISILIVFGLVIAIVQQVGFQGSSKDLIDGLSEPLIQLALVMVAFLLGSELKLDKLRNTGALIMLISISVILVSAVFVGAGLYLLGFPLVVAVSLAAISVATDPAAVSESIRESRDKRLLAKVLLGIVAIDDAWGVLVFGLCMAVLGWIISQDGAQALLHAFWELGGAIIVGIAIGLPAAWLTGQLRRGEPTLVEAIAVILLLSGMSTLLGVSALLASMVAGALVANLSHHHTRSFREIEHIEWPFLVFFFVLSGASIDLYKLDDAMLLTLCYILLRFAGRVVGGYVGLQFKIARVHQLPWHIGIALTPQAGVAIGMALLAAERFPEWHDTILPVVVASTLFFEIIGPFLVRKVLKT
jgi:NhaP-type Na+/H+ or K+/H+ antiporter